MSIGKKCTFLNMDFYGYTFLNFFRNETIVMAFGGLYFFFNLNNVVQPPFIGLGLLYSHDPYYGKDVSK